MLEKAPNQPPPPVMSSALKGRKKAAEVAERIAARDKK